MARMLYPIVGILLPTTNEKDLRLSDLKPVDVSYIKTIDRLIVILENEENVQEARDILSTKPIDKEIDFLATPTISKNQAISPPPSPPVGWVSKPEDPPTQHKDLDLEAKELANIIIGKLAKPGENYVLFSQTEKTPGVTLTTDG